MQESMQVLEWQAQAYQRGRADGVAEGKAEGKAEAILQLARRRLQQEVPPDLAARVRAATDLAMLDQWFSATMDLTSLDDFRRLVQG